MASPLRLLLTSVALTAAAHAQILYVNASLTTGANNGSSWLNAFQGSQGLHAALAAAAPGTEIWVATGTYLPSDVADPSASFTVARDRITVRGGFESNEQFANQRRPGGNARTVLSGDLLGDDDGSASSTVENSAVVLGVEANFVTLDGLTVASGGNAFDGASFVATAGPNSSGSSDPQITLTGCRFIDGVRVGARMNVLRPFEVTDCVFAGNGGDGMQVSSNGSPGSSISRSTFAENGGDGLRVVSGDLPIPMSNLLVVNNGGHGVVRAFFFVTDGSQQFDQCTIAHNGGVGVSMAGCSQCFVTGLRLRSSILWGNNQGGAQVDFPGSTGPALELIDSIVEGRAGAAGQDPLFADPLAGDFSLMPASPAVDRVVGSASLDAGGQYRTFDVPGFGANGSTAVSDLGALEFTGSIGVHTGCDAVPNSTGLPGRLFARGSAEVAVNSFTLRGDQLPPGQFAIAIVSRQLGLTTMLSGPGSLCLSGPIGRVDEPGQVLPIDSSGVFSLGLDLTRVPTPNQFVAVQPGESWTFQLWHRDVPSLSQFSGIVSVRFE